jgi:hypothetical protein
MEDLELTGFFEGNEPVVSRAGVFNNQVCVPSDYTNNQVIRFLESEHPAGTSGGWFIQEELGRVPCSERKGFVHIVLAV